MSLNNGSLIKLSDTLTPHEGKEVYWASVAEGSTFSLEHVKTFSGTDKVVAFMKRPGPYRLVDFTRSLGPILREMNNAGLLSGDLTLIAKPHSGKDIARLISAHATAEELEEGLKKAGVTDDTVDRIIARSSGAIFSADINDNKSNLAVSVDADNERAAEIAFEFLAETLAIKNSGLPASEVGRLVLKAVSNPQHYQRQKP